MTDNAERWRNVAQAAQWLAEGREVEWKRRAWTGGGSKDWSALPIGAVLSVDWEYRLKPEPPKPREFSIVGRGLDMVAIVLDGGRPVAIDERIRVREVIE